MQETEVLHSDHKGSPVEDCFDLTCMKFNISQTGTSGMFLIELVNCIWQMFVAASKSNE